MSWQEIRTRVMDANSTTVAWFRALPGLEGDRDITSFRSRRRVAHLQTKLRKGNFLTPVWCICLCKETGKTYRLNGQASSLVLSEANGYVPPDLQVIVREIEADTYADAVDAFTNFDTPISSRPPTEQASPILKSKRSTREVRPSYAIKAIRGIVCWQSGGRGKRIDDDERNDMLVDHERFVAWASQFIPCKTISSSVGIVAAMFATFSASIKQATDFWQRVIHEDSPDPECPSRTLADFLTRRLQDPLENRRWPTLAVMVKCLHAWNAWVSRKTTNLSYYADAKGLPDVLVRREGRVVKADVEVPTA